MVCLVSLEPWGLNQNASEVNLCCSLNQVDSQGGGHGCRRWGILWFCIGCFNLGWVYWLVSFDQLETEGDMLPYCWCWLLLEGKGNAKCEWQFINWNRGAIIVDLCDLCHEGKPVCGPGSWVGCPMNKGVTANPLAGSILLKSPDEWSGPLRGFEGIVWDSILHEGGHSSPPVQLSTQYGSTSCKDYW